MKGIGRFAKLGNRTLRGAQKPKSSCAAGVMATDFIVCPDKTTTGFGDSLIQWVQCIRRRLRGLYSSRFKLADPLQHWDLTIFKNLNCCIINEPSKRLRNSAAHDFFSFRHSVSNTQHQQAWKCYYSNWRTIAGTNVIAEQDEWRYAQTTIKK